jgi:hypothetical protein
MDPLADEYDEPYGGCVEKEADNLGGDRVTVGGGAQGSPWHDIEDRTDDYAPSCGPTESHRSAL